MSNRYINKKARKDIYSNSGAVATANFVDSTNSLESLVNNPVSGSILVVPDITNNDCYNYYDNFTVLGKEAVGDAVLKVSYAKSHPVAAPTSGSGYQIYFNNSSQQILYYNGSIVPNASILILEVSGSSNNLITLNSYYYTNGSGRLDRDGPLVDHEYIFNDNDEKYYWVENGNKLNVFVAGKIYIDNDGFGTVGSGITALTYPVSGIAGYVKTNDGGVNEDPVTFTSNGTAGATGGLELGNKLRLPTGSKYLDSDYLAVGQDFELSYVSTPFKLFFDKTTNKRLGGGLVKFDIANFWVGL